MSKVLVFLEQSNSEVSKVSLSAVTAARQVAEKWNLNDIYGVMLGENASQAAEQATNYGFIKVFYSENAGFSKYVAANYAACISALAKTNECSLVIAAATSTSRDFLPLVAHTLDAGQASDVIAVNDDASLKRPMYAGNILADVEILSDNKVISVRASAFDVAATASKGQAEEISSIPEFTTQAEVLSYEIPEKGRPELTDASMVVSGGRAFGSTENFEKYLYPLADKLNAAIGASRAAVDSGYVPNDWQVGQTGKIVAPDLYIAIGISGAVQHLAGMKDSKVIVAINKDPEAPIFEISDYGLAGDLFEILPELTEKI